MRGSGETGAGGRSNGGAAGRVSARAGEGATGVPAASAPSGLARAASGLWRFLVSLPGFGAALLPVGVCPACWPAYAGILGALGIGFLLESTYLFPLTAAFLGLALFSLAFRSKNRRGLGPFVLGSLSTLLILVFKFAVVSTPAVYAGLGGFLIASIWNAWPVKRGKPGSCPECLERNTEA